MGIFNYIELTKDVVKIFPNWNLVSTPVKIHWILDGFNGSELNILGDRSALGAFMNEKTVIPPFSDATPDELEKYPNIFNFIRLNRQNVISKFKKWNDDNISISIKIHWILDGCEGPRIFSLDPIRRNRIDGDLKALSNFLNLRNILPDVTKFDFIQPLTVQIELVSEEDKHIILSDVKLQELSSLKSLYTNEFTDGYSIVNNDEYGSIANSPIKHLCYDDLHGNNIVASELDSDLIMTKIDNEGDTVEDTTRIVPFRGYESRNLLLNDASYNLYPSSFNGINKEENMLDTDLNSIWESNNNLYFDGNYKGHANLLSSKKNQLVNINLPDINYEYKEHPNIDLTSNKNESYILRSSSNFNYFKERRFDSGYLINIGKLKFDSNENVISHWVLDSDENIIIGYNKSLDEGGGLRMCKITQLGNNISGTGRYKKPEGDLQSTLIDISNQYELLRTYYSDDLLLVDDLYSFIKSVNFNNITQSDSYYAFDGDTKTQWKSTLNRYNKGDDFFSLQDFEFLSDDNVSDDNDSTYLKVEKTEIGNKISYNKSFSGTESDKLYRFYYKNALPNECTISWNFEANSDSVFLLLTSRPLDNWDTVSSLGNLIIIQNTDTEIIGWTSHSSLKDRVCNIDGVQFIISQEDGAFGASNKGGREIKIEKNGTLQASLTNLNNPSKKWQFKREDSSTDIENTGNWYLYGAIEAQENNISELILNIDGSYIKKPTILPSLEVIPVNLPEELTNSTNVINNIDLITNPKFYDASGSTFEWGIQNVMFEDWVVNEYNGESGAEGRPRVNLIFNSPSGWTDDEPTELDSEIQYFIGIQGYNSWISQIIHIDTPGKYILKFLCARRRGDGEVPITIEFNNTTETHILNTHEFAELSYSYDITESGDYNLKFTNIIDASGVLANDIPPDDPGETAFITNISFYYVGFVDFNLEVENEISGAPYIFYENISPIRIKPPGFPAETTISIELVTTLVNPVNPCTIFNIIDSSGFQQIIKLELEFNLEVENELEWVFSWIKADLSSLVARTHVLVGQQTHFVFTIDSSTDIVTMFSNGINIPTSISNENISGSMIIGDTDYITLGGLDCNYVKNINRFDLFNYKKPKYIIASSGDSDKAFDDNSDTLWETTEFDENNISENYIRESGIYKGTSKLGDSYGEYLIMDFDSQETVTGIFIKKNSLEGVYIEPTEATRDTPSSNNVNVTEDLWYEDNNYYSCSASSQQDDFNQAGSQTSYSPKNVFNDDAGQSLSPFIWSSAKDTYYDSVPTITDQGLSTNLGLDSSGTATANGEYIIFNMPYYRKFKGINISSASFGEQFIPKKWRVYGRTTPSSSWEELMAQNNTKPGTIPEGGTTWELDSPTEKAYSSFALVIEELNSTPDFLGTVVMIEDIKFLCMPSEEFKVYGRNTGTDNWDIIHSEENTNITNDGKYFIFDQINKYKYYGLIFTNNQGYYNLQISEIKLICGTNMDLSNSSPGSIITDFNIYNESLDSSGIDYLYTRFTNNYENSLTVDNSGRYFKIENRSEWVAAFGAFGTSDENNNRNIYWIRQVRNNQEIRQGSIVVINPNSIDYLYGRYHEETGSLITNHDWNIDDQIIVYARQYPYVKMVSNSQNSDDGLNFCFSSTNPSSSFHVFDGNNDTIWESSNTFVDTSGGLYNGTSSQDGSGGILESGEWISYELPKSIVLWGIIIVADNENLDSAPCDFKVYGSNDLGIPNSNHQWEELLSIENANPAGLSNSLYNRNGTLYQLTSISSSYKHFNLLINKTVNSSSCKIVEIQYIGIETEKDWKVEDNLGNYGEYLELELSQPAVINEIKITSNGELEIEQSIEDTYLIYNWDSERKIIYPKTSNNLTFSYDATGTTFNNATESHENPHTELRTDSNAIYLSDTYDISGLTGTAPRTIIATFNINTPTVAATWLHHVIVGYGTVASGQQFALRVSSHPNRGGDASGGVYALGFWGNSGADHWLDSNTGTISAGVETTAAVSWDGTNIYLFLKNSSTGQWVMDSNPESVNTGTAYGLMIGAWPANVDEVEQPEVLQPFHGTIGEVTIYDFAVTTTDNIENLFSGKTNYFESNTNIHNQVSFTVKNGNKWIVGLKSGDNDIVSSSIGSGLAPSAPSGASATDEEIEEFKFEANGSNCFVKDASGEKIISSDSYYFNDNLLQIIVDKASSKVRFWMNGNKLHEYDVSYIGDWYIFAHTDENSVIDFVSSNSFRKDFKIFGKKKPINPKNYKLKIIGSGSGGAFVIIAEIKLQNIDTGEYITLTNPTASSVGWSGVDADKAIDDNLATYWHSLSRNGNGSSIENIWWKADVTLESNASYRIYVTGRGNDSNESSPIIVQLFDSNETTILAESYILTHSNGGAQITAEWEFMTRTDEENWIEIHSENGVSISHNGSNFSFYNNISYDIYSLVITSNDSLPTYDSFVWKNEVNIASEDNSDASGTTLNSSDGHYNYLSEYAFFNRVSLSEVKFLERYTVEDNGYNPINSEDGKYFYINKDSFISAFGYGTPNVSDSNWGNTIYIVKQLRNDGNDLLYEWSGEILIHWWESYGIGRKNSNAQASDWINNDEIRVFGTQYPTESLDSINQNGYNVTISDGLDENNAYKLFSRPDDSEDTLQVWNMEHYNHLGYGEYDTSGNSNMGLDNGGIAIDDYGEWVILEMPVPLNIKAFIVKTTDSSGLEFSIYGSNDKKRWAKIEYILSNNNDGLYEIYKIIEAYSYFGFVVTNILNSITNIQYFGSLITEVDYGEYINLELGSKEILGSIKIGDYSNNTSILENFSYPSAFKVYGSKEIIEEDDSPYKEYSAGSMYLGEKLVHPVVDEEYIVGSSSYKDEYTKIENLTYQMPDTDKVTVNDSSGTVLFRYLQIRALGTQICNLMEVQAWVGGINIAAYSQDASGASPAEWRNYEYPDSYTTQDTTQDTTQQSMSWEYEGHYHSASLVNNNILGNEISVNSNYPFAHSSIAEDLGVDHKNWFSILIDLGKDYNFYDLQAIVVYNRQEDGEFGERIQGFKPQLLDENGEVVYDGVPFMGRDYYHRINGPAWNSVQDSLLTVDENDFATKIINISNSIGIINTTIYGTDYSDYYKFQINSKNNIAKIVLSELPEASNGIMIIKYRMWVAGVIVSEENQEEPVKSNEEERKRDYLYVMPCDWYFQGSNDDGSTWTTIHSVVGYTKHKGWDSFESSDIINIEEKPYSEFYVTSPGVYKQYRLYILKTRANLNENTESEYTVTIGDLGFYYNNNYSKNVLYSNNKWKSINSFTTNGSYAGTANLGIDSGGDPTYYGEYLKIEIPNSEIVSNIKLICSENIVYDIICYLSNDGILWTPIAASTQAQIDADGYSIDLNSNGLSFKYYGLVFTSVIYSATGFVANIIEYNIDESTQNTSYINETSYIDEPSLIDGAAVDLRPTLWFTNPPNEPPEAQGLDTTQCVSIDKIEITTSKIGYNGPEYSYSIDGISLAGYDTELGEYKTLSVGKNIKVNSVKIISKKIENGPKDFKIYGSIDGLNWTEILDVINASPRAADGGGSIYYFDNSIDFYSYFTLVVTKLVNSEKLDIEEIIYYSEPWDLLYNWNIGNVGIKYYSNSLYIKNNEDGRILEYSLPHTFNNSEYLSIEPIQIGPGMSYEISYIFDEASTNTYESCLLYIGNNDNFNGQWYRIIRSNDGKIIDIIVRTSGQDNSNDWQYKQNFDTPLSNIHLVWVIHEDGYGASIYINGQLFSKDLGLLETNLTLEQENSPLFLYTPEMISVGGNWESNKNLADSNPGSVLTKFKIYNKVLSATEVLKQYEEYSIQSASLTHKIENMNDYIAFGIVLSKSNNINSINVGNEKVYYNTENYDITPESRNIIINDLEIGFLGEKINYSELFGPISSQSDLIKYYSFGTIDPEISYEFNHGIYFNLQNPILNGEDSPFVSFEKVTVSTTIEGYDSSKSIDQSLDTFYKSEKDGINTWTGRVGLPISRSSNYRLSVTGSLEENINTGTVLVRTKDSNGNLIKEYSNLTYYNHEIYNQIRDSIDIEFLWSPPPGRHLITNSLLCKYTDSLVNSIESSIYVLVKSYYGVFIGQNYDLDTNYIEINNELTTNDPNFMTTNSGFVFIDNTNNFNLDSNWTFSLWVRIKPTENKTVYLFNNNNSLYGQSYINISLNQDVDETTDLGKLTIQFMNSNGEYSINKSNIVPSCDLRDNNWHHICLIFEYITQLNISNIQLYIDTQIQDSTTDNSLEYLDYTAQINGSFNNNERDSYFCIGNRGSINLEYIQDNHSTGSLDIRNISFFNIVINYEELELLYNEEYIEQIDVVPSNSSAPLNIDIPSLNLEFVPPSYSEAPADALPGQYLEETPHQSRGSEETPPGQSLEETPLEETPLEETPLEETIPSYVMRSEVKYGTTNYIMSKPELSSKPYIISKPKAIRYNRRHIVSNEVVVEPWIIFGTNDYSISSEESGHWSINNTSKFVGILYDISESDELTILNNEIFLFTDGYNNTGKIHGIKTKYIDGNINNHLKIQFKKDSNMPENIKIQIRGLGNEFVNKYIQTLFFTIKADNYSNLKSYNHSRVSTYDAETISISLINGNESGFGPLVYKWSAIQKNLSLYKFTINKISNRFNNILDGISVLIEPQPEPEPEFMEPEPEPEFMEPEPEPEPELLEPEPESELIPRVELGTRGFVYNKISETLKYVNNVSIYIGRLFCDVSETNIYLFSDGYNETGEYNNFRIPYNENNIENHIEIRFNEDIGEKSIQIKANDPKFNNKYIHTLYFSVNSGDYSILESKNHTGFVRNSKKIFIPGQVSINMIGYTDIDRNDSPQVYKWETMCNNKSLYETRLNKTTEYFTNILDRINILSKDDIRLIISNRKSKIEFGTNGLEIFSEISELPRTMEKHRLLNNSERTNSYICRLFKLIKKEGSIQRKYMYLFKDGYNYTGLINENRLPYTCNDINNNIVIRIKNLRTVQIKAVTSLFENCYIDILFFNVNLNINISNKNHVGVHRKGKISILEIIDPNRFKTRKVYKWKSFERNNMVCDYSVNKITTEYTDILDRIDIGTLG